MEQKHEHIPIPVEECAICGATRRPGGEWITLGQMLRARDQSTSKQRSKRASKVWADMRSGQPEQLSKRVEHLSRISRRRQAQITEAALLESGLAPGKVLQGKYSTRTILKIEGSVVFYKTKWTGARRRAPEESVSQIHAFLKWIEDQKTAP